MKILKNEKGYALFITIALILLVSVIGLGLQILSVNAKKTTINERDDQATFYVAEAGVNLEKADIINVITNLNIEILEYFNDLPSKKQEEIVNVKGFNAFYNENLINNFSSAIASLDNINFQGNNTYKRHFQLSDQFQKQPVVDTEVKLECTSEDCNIVITSIGYYDSNSTNSRKVSQMLEIKPNQGLPIETIGGDQGTGNGGNDDVNEDVGESPNPLEDYTVMVNGDITLTGSGTIHGNAGSIGGTIKISGGAKIEGSISAANPDKLDYPNWMTGVDEKYTELPEFITQENQDNYLEGYLPTFPDDLVTAGDSIAYPENKIIGDKKNQANLIKDGNFNADKWNTNNYTLKLDSDTKFNQFNVGQNNTIVIDVGDKEVNLYIDDLNISQGHIKIIGTGKLNIITNKISSIKGSFNKNGDPGAVNIYHYGNDKLSFSGETQLYGSLHVKNSDLTLTGGAGFYGNIYSGGSKVNISGGVPTNGQWIVAPNAELNLTGGGTIKGTVIADSVKSSGGTSISYGEAVVPNPSRPGKPSEPGSEIKYEADLTADPILVGPLVEHD